MTRFIAAAVCFVSAVSFAGDYRKTVTHEELRRAREHYHFNLEGLRQYAEGQIENLPPVPLDLPEENEPVEKIASPKLPYLLGTIEPWEEFDDVKEGDTCPVPWAPKKPGIFEELPAPPASDELEGPIARKDTFHSATFVSRIW